MQKMAYPARGPRLLFLVAVALAAGWRPASGQEPADRAALEAFRDSMAQAADSAALRRLEAQHIQVARMDRHNALLHLRLGFLALRMGDLGVPGAHEAAASEFEWARDLQPEWPYPWYGIGLAEARIGDSQVALVSGLKTMLGKDALTKSAIAFARAAAIDPSFVDGLTELGATALRQRVNVKLDVALEALRLASTTAAGKHPEVLLVRGRVEREVGSPDSALAAFRRYLDAGGDAGMGQLELARTEFMLGRPEGEAPYYAGAASPTPATVAAYRLDLAYIAPDSSLAAFDAASGPARVEFLREFWSGRDAVGLRPDGERLREHYRRLAYARKHFVLVGHRRVYDITEIWRSGSTEFDDRGLIYIRHGAPSDRATYTAPNINPNESWRYAKPDGDLLFHFTAVTDVQDFRLVESVLDVLGYQARVLSSGQGMLSADPNGPEVQLLVSRERLSPIYSRLQSAGQGATARYQAEERTLTRRSVAEGTTSDSYDVRFDRPLTAITQVLAVGADGDRTGVLITYAIPGSALEGLPTQRGTIYPIRLRFVASGPNGVVARLDTTRVFLARTPVPGAEHLVGRVTAPVPPGTWEWRLALQEGERAGFVTPTASVTVAPVDGAALGLSDPVLGSATGGVAWRPTPSDSVPLNPVRRFWPDEELHLYYEATGMLRGEQYRTEIAINRASREAVDALAPGRLFKDAVLTLRFDEEAGGPLVRSQRTIDLRKLKPGDYTLSVIVTDASRRVARRSQTFRVAAR
ncbi:MAG TPA: GWxTD domain-containing protein [Gemmatimonadales bacterium]|nr:GWxTD domain-containing protein [Gemmatimonadales bacterium]